MKTGIRKFLFVVSSILCGFLAFLFFIGGLCVGIADIPSLNYPLTAIVPRMTFLTLDIMFILLPVIMHRYWKEKSCRTWWKVFGILFGVFFILSLVSRPINIAIQENNIMYIPRSENISLEPDSDNVDTSSEAPTEKECDHQLQEQVVKEASENTVGEKRYICEKCGYSYTEEIPTIEPEVPETSEPLKPEILFREIPWDSTSKEAKQLLKATTPSASTTIWENAFMLFPEKMLDVNSVDGVNEAGNILYASDLTAGGYDIRTAQLYFIYTVQNGKINRDSDAFYAALYYFDVANHEAVYNDLWHKMTNIYGEGRERTKTASGWIAASDYSGKYEYDVTRTTWYGDNNTYVTLQWVSAENEADSIQNSCGISMLYGVTDAESRLDDLEKLLATEKAEQDKEKAEGNKDGL